MVATDTLPRFVIVGAGFRGLEAAKALRNVGVDIMCSNGDLI